MTKLKKNLDLRTNIYRLSDVCLDCVDQIKEHKVECRECAVEMLKKISTKQRSD